MDTFYNLTNYSVPTSKKDTRHLFCSMKESFSDFKKRNDFGDFWRRIWTHVYINVNDNFGSKFFFFWETLSTMLLANQINLSRFCVLMFQLVQNFFFLNLLFLKPRLQILVTSDSLSPFALSLHLSSQMSPGQSRHLPPPSLGLSFRHAPLGRKQNKLKTTTTKSVWALLVLGARKAHLLSFTCPVSLRTRIPQWKSTCFFRGGSDLYTSKGPQDSILSKAFFFFLTHNNTKYKCTK